MDESTPLLSTDDGNSQGNEQTDVEQQPDNGNASGSNHIIRHPCHHGDLLTRHEKAAWIIDETARGGVIEAASDAPDTRSIRSLYLFYMNASLFRQAAVIGLVLLSFVELPSWCSSYKSCVAPQNTNYFLSGVPYISAQYAIATNFILLAILIAFAILDMRLPTVRVEGFRRLHSAILGALVLDFIYVLIFGGYPPIRIAPFFRACLPLFYWAALAESFTSIFAVINPFFNVVVFVMIFTFLFGWVITLFFHDIPEAEYYFGDLGRGLNSAFTSMTTADWPMQVMGVLSVSRSTAILLVFFIVIGVFLLLNVLLAVVYNAYTSHIESLVLEKLRERRKSIGVAFDILSGPDNDTVSPTDITILFTELRKNRKHAHFSDEMIDMVFTALDDDGSRSLSREEFMDIVDVLQLKFVVEMESLSPIMTRFPDFYESPQWQNTMKFVRSDTFSYIIDAFMIFNVIVVGIETSLDISNRDTPTSALIFSFIECGFSVVYITEMVLKICTLGFDAYWRDRGNQFDFLVTWLLLFASAYVIIPFIELSQDIVRLFILLRCLRLFELLADVRRFRRLVHVFSVLVPASLPLFTLLSLSLYVFAAAGTELFGGLIYAGNPALNPEQNPTVDAFVSANYWALNFNDLAAGWFTLFSSVVVGYLTEIASAIESASSFGSLTKIFFILSFVVNTLIVSNCVVAFVVDLFIMEDEAEEDPGLKALQSRYGSHRVKVLQNKTTAHQVYATMFRDRIEHIMQGSENDPSENNSVQDA